MFVKPKPGSRVLDPDSKLPVPPEGRDVPETNYWVRRLLDGDLLRAEPPRFDSAEDDVIRLEPIPDSDAHESADQGKE